MKIARKELGYSSYKIWSDYQQLICNLHLFLLDKKLIVDFWEVYIEEFSFQPENSSEPEGFIVRTIPHNLRFEVLVLEFDEYVHRGFKLAC